MADPSSGSTGGTTTYTTVINGVTEVVVVQNTVTVVQASAGVGSSSLATVIASEGVVSGSDSFTNPVPSTTNNGEGAGAETSAEPVTSSEVPIGSTVVVVVTAPAQSESAQVSSSSNPPPNTPSSQSLQAVASSAAGALSGSNDAVPTSVAGSAVAANSFVFPTSSGSSIERAESSTVAVVLNEDVASSTANIHSATSGTASVASAAASAPSAAITASAASSSAGSASDSSDSDVTYVYSGITLTGTAAAAAMAEAGSSTSTSSTVTSVGGSKLSSFAIVGIVAGVLVGLIVLYLLWYSWRKKSVESKRQDMDLGDPLDDEKDQARPETMHFGFDFIDEPPSASSSSQTRPGRSTTRDPFDEERYSVAPDTDTWYQDPNDVEYLSGSSGVVGVGNQWGGDDDGATVIGENLHTGYTYSLFTTRPSPHRQMSEPAINPFVPPVPPLPSTYTSSGRRVSDSGYHGLRPGTTVSHAESMNYEDIYGGYADSRPGTFFVPDQSTNRATIVEPATSMLLGWDRPVGQPPVPPLPEMWQETVYEEQGDEMERMGGRNDTSGMVEDLYQANVAARIREPVRAAMAKTPVQQIESQSGGAGAYPGFR